MSRIVHVCPRYLPALGGVETFFVRLSEAAAARGDVVSVWTTDASTVRGFTRTGEPRLAPGPERIHGVEVRRFPIRYWPAQRWTRTAAHLLPFGTRWKCQTLRWTPDVAAMTSEATRFTGHVDLVHAAGLPYSSLLFAGLRLAERTGAKLVMSPFNHVAPPGARGARMRRAYLSPLNLRLLRRADRVFVQTALERRLLADAGIAISRQTTVGLGVDPEETAGGNRARARAGWGATADTVVIGHLGNKSWDKGTIDLLDAAERLWARGRSFLLVLAGPEMPAFTERWATTANRERVINLPELSDEGRRDFFSGVDVFALPSYVESFGLSSLEAALNGAAVVAYDHGGPSEIFRHDVNALLASAGDIEALAAAVDRVVVDPIVRTRIATAGLEVARAFSWPRALGSALEAYDQLLRVSSQVLGAPCS